MLVNPVAGDGEEQGESLSLGRPTSIWFDSRLTRTALHHNVSLKSTACYARSTARSPARPLAFVDVPRVRPHLDPALASTTTSPPSGSYATGRRHNHTRALLRRQLPVVPLASRAACPPRSRRPPPSTHAMGHGSDPLADGKGGVPAIRGADARATAPHVNTHRRRTAASTDPKSSSRTVLNPTTSRSRLTTTPSRHSRA